MMAGNSETTTNRTPYVERHGPTDEDSDTAPRRRSSSLTMSKIVPLPPRGIVAMPAAATAAVRAHMAASTQREETLG